MIYPPLGKGFYEQKMDFSEIEQRIKQLSIFGSHYQKDVESISNELTALMKIDPVAVVQLVERNKGIEDSGDKVPFLKVLISNNCEDLVCQLLTNGIAIPESSLHLAAEYGSIKIVDALLNRGMNINENLEDINDPINRAFTNTLFQVDEQTVFESPIAIASREGHFGLVDFLLDKGANPNAVDQNFSVIGNLIRHNAPTELITKLIQNGGDVNFLDSKGKLPLFYAIQSGQPEIVKLLLVAGANKSLNQLYDFGNSFGTSLHFAVTKGNVDIIKILLDYEANPNIASKNSKRENTLTPFQQAVYFLVTKNEDDNLKVLYREISQIFIDKFGKAGLKAKSSDPQITEKIQKIFSQTTGTILENTSIPCRISPSSNEMETIARNTINRLTKIEDKTLAKIVKPLLEILKKECEQNKNFLIYFISGQPSHDAGCYDLTLENIQINVDPPFFPNNVLVHELAHLAAQRVFNYQCRPYSSPFEEIKGDDERFKEARAFAECKLLDNKSNPIFSRIYQGIFSYPEDVRDGEAFARIPQLAWELYETGLKGSKLEKKLKETIPQLYDYYKNVFTPLVIPQQESACLIS